MAHEFDDFAFIDAPAAVVKSDPSKKKEVDFPKTIAIPDLSQICSNFEEKFASFMKETEILRLEREKFQKEVVEREERLQKVLLQSRQLNTDCQDRTKDLLGKLNQFREFDERTTKSLEILERQSDTLTQLRKDVSCNSNKVSTIESNLTKQESKLKGVENAIRDQAGAIEEQNVKLSMLEEQNLELEQQKTNLEKELQHKLDLLQKQNSKLDEQTVKLTEMESTLHECRLENEKSKKNLKKLNKFLQKFKIERPALLLDDAECWNCKRCQCQIAVSSDIESKSYQVGQGAFTESKRGYLFSKAYNLLNGKTKSESFTSGEYKIELVYCMVCQTELGWQYIDATKESNKHKLSKYCLSRYSLIGPPDRKEE